MSVLILGYVTVLRPFDETLDNIQQITFELTIFLVNIALLAMAVRTELSETILMQGTG